METKVVQQTSDVVVVELTAREAAETEVEISNPLGTAELDAQFEFMPFARDGAKAAFFGSQWRVTEATAETIRVERNAAPTITGPQAQLWLRKRAAVPVTEGAARSGKARAKTAPKAKPSRRVPVQKGTPPNPPRAA